jgi:hypothetical protein
MLGVVWAGTIPAAGVGRRISLPKTKLPCMLDLDGGDRCPPIPGGDPVPRDAEGE